MPDNGNDHNKENAQFPIPKNLMDAISAVQRLFLMEDKGKSLPADYLVVSQIRAFMWIGVNTAIEDSVIWVSLYVLLGAVAYFIQVNFLEVITTKVFIWNIPGSPLYWAVKAGSFAALIFHTGLSAYVGRYYVGNACKKAINSIIITRAMYLFSFGCVIFIGLNMANAYLLSDEMLDGLRTGISYVNEKNSFVSHSFFTGYLRRAFFEASIISLITSFISLVIPFMSIMYFGISLRRDKVLGPREE